MGSPFLRRRRLSVIVLLAATAALCSPAGASAATQGARCDARSGTTLVADREVRVFERRRRVEGRVVSTSTYACGRRTGRLKAFGDAESGKDSAGIPLLTAAGSFVAAVYDVETRRSVVVWNARTGATRVYNASAGPELRSSMTFAPKDMSLVLTAKGHAAWISEAGALGPGYVVHVGIGPSTENPPTIAQDAALAPDSLAAAGGLVHWTQGGVARSAALA